LAVDQGGPTRSGDSLEDCAGGLSTRGDDADPKLQRRHVDWLVAEDLAFGKLPLHPANILLLDLSRANALLKSHGNLRFAPQNNQTGGEVVEPVES